MANSSFLERLQTGKPLVLDGATGTNLQTRGLPVGTPSDLWVLDNPDEVLRLHRDFLAGRSDIILTNTFGSSRIHLATPGWKSASRRPTAGRWTLAHQARDAVRRAGGRLDGTAGRDGRAGGHAERGGRRGRLRRPGAICWPKPGWTCW